MNSKVDVVVVNWNSGTQLLECIESLRSYASQCIGKVIVIDNGSVDGSANCLNGLSGLEVVVIEAGENLGFGKACNVGAKEGESDYILFLNPDASVYESTLRQSLTYMNDHSRVGVCGVQLKDETNHVSRSCTRLPSVTSFLAHAVGLDRILPKLGHFMGEWDHNDSRLVDHVIGAFYLVRRTVFESVGGFDERFFVYLEDLDLSNRIKAAGWQIFFLANIQAFHKGGGTSDQVKAFRLFYSLRSRIIYSFKHFNTFGATLILLATLFVEPASRVLHSALRCSLPSVKETLIAYKYLWKWFPAWLFKKTV